ncbi:MAG: B12-binding domain-containing radical SAM protein [Clostridiales bacterium]|nr:B12-binding domain-containing radical SAM protein [Clostridiales bacterium]
MKIRFIEPGNLPYRPSLKNYFVYDKYIRTPSHGVLTLATIVRQVETDVLAYSESISKIRWEDVLDADIVFISIFTFSANRGYDLADYIKSRSKALVVFGGLHATLCYEEAAAHGDYVLVGEGDELILEFIDSIKNGRPATCPGVAYRRRGETIFTGRRRPPENIDTVPDRHLLYRYKKMAGHNTLWPQVHASRGCPHSCDYCSLIAAFGRCLRTRSPESVVADIKAAVDFYDTGHRRLVKLLWITDDNFFADRDWAVRVLQAIIDSGIRYSFTVQARYEVGFDDEMLELLKRAGFVELALGIEFLEDEAFAAYHKKSTYQEILSAVQNIQRHGLRTRGLFIVGADNHTAGVGQRLADFVIQNNICGVLIQSMYFIPGTPVYESHKDALLEQGNWSRCKGRVVHRPAAISACELQKEIIIASKKIYSFRRLLAAVLHKRGAERILFMGEYFWQREVRRDLKRDLTYLKSLSEKKGRSTV